MSRPERVAELIKREISSIIREKVSDPRIGFLSVTSVDISSDLKNAKIFISVLGDDLKIKETMQGLKSATSFIRGELGNNLDLRFVPDIMFVYDKSIERASKVLSIMTRMEMESKSKKGIRKTES